MADGLARRACRSAAESHADRPNETAIRRDTLKPFVLALHLFVKLIGKQVQISRANPIHNSPAEFLAERDELLRLADLERLQHQVID